MNWGQLIDLIGKLLAAAAVVLGSGWVLWNYIVGRTHKPRLQLRISGERVSRQGLEYLVIKAELSNVGQARVKLANDGCVVKVETHRLPRRFTDLMEPRWGDTVTFDLFQHQTWVEPSGLLLDQQLVALPGVESKFLRV